MRKKWNEDEKVKNTNRMKLLFLIDYIPIHGNTYLVTQIIKSINFNKDQDDDLIGVII